MRLRHLLPALFLSIPLSVLGVACGDDSIDQGTAAPPPSDGSGSVSSPPASDSTPPVPGSGQAATIRNRTDLTDARVLEPESVTGDPANNRRLLVRFWGGVEPCFGAEVRVVESPSDVKVTVLGGAPPEGRDKSCIALAKLYEVSADLASPLGSRAIVVVK